MARTVAIWAAIQGCSAPSRQDRSKALVQPESIRTGTTRAANAIGSRKAQALPAAANTAAKPTDNTRQLRTAMEYQSSTRPQPDDPGRCAHSYGSEGSRP